MKMRMSSFFAAVGALIVIALIITLFCAYTDLPIAPNVPEPPRCPVGYPL
ncbi:MAG: hypothetical protein AB7D36_00860 [Oscillospiraceae bacterium]